MARNGFLGRLIRRLVLLTAIAVLVVAAGLYTSALMRVNRFEAAQSAPRTTYYASNGDVIATPSEVQRIYVPLNRIPRSLQLAIVGIEDSQFYEHKGINIRSIARALFINLLSGRVVQGGSTITQQLAKTIFLSPERTLARKLEEAFLAIELERRYSKDKILEMYLNNIYLGSGNTGVQAAALSYFGKSVSDLTLAESALIAGLPKAPSLYSPLVNPQLARARRNVVLGRMDELGYITPAQATTAQAEPVRTAGAAEVASAAAPYFTQYVTQLLIDRFGEDRTYRGGLQVYTTLDPAMQAAANAAFKKVQGALVAIDPRNGQIKAMVGGRSYAESQFNRATLAFRQPGSAFKPFVYVTAFEHGFTQNMIFEDAYTDFNGYAPINYDDKFKGQMTIKQAVVDSRNVIAVKVLQQVGVDAVIKTATWMGIDSLTRPDRNLTLALGGLTKGVTPLTLTAGYVPLANGGFAIQPVAITRVTDSKGKTLWVNSPRPKRVIHASSAYLMTDILRAVIEYGTGQAAKIGRPAAGKTGTTNNKATAWFVGYTPDLVATVYVGNDDGTPVGLSGGTIAAPIWQKFMSRALANRPITDFTPPPDVVTGVPISIYTGQPASVYTPSSEVEWDAFVQGTVPWQYAQSPGAWQGAFRPFPAPTAGGQQRTTPTPVNSEAAGEPPLALPEEPQPEPPLEPEPPGQPPLPPAQPGPQPPQPSLPEQPPVEAPATSPAPPVPPESGTPTPAHVQRKRR